MGGQAPASLCGRLLFFPPSLPTFRDTCRGQRRLAGAPVQFLPQLLPGVLESVQDPKSQLPFPV